MNGASKPAAEVTTIATTNTPLEKFCAIGDPLIIEWKGKRYHTLMRAVKQECITTNILGGKPRLTVLRETSYIIADMPNGYAEAGFEYNSPLIVRFLSGGSVFAFKTMLMLLYNRPPVLVLEYPNEVQRYNLRSSQRLVIVSPARISENGGSTSKTGVVLDISKSGARIGLEAVEGISVGGRLRLSFTLPNGSAVNQLAADVRSIEEENGKYQLGISFWEHDPVVSGYCRDYAVFAGEAQPVWGNAMLGLEKEAVIEFARKSGQVILRGWKMGEKGYLLTEKPEGALPPLPVGGGAIIRVENRGTVYGMSAIYKEFLKKTDLCLFTIQNDVISHSLRSQERVQCLLPVNVHRGEDAAAAGSGVIVNLGKGGLRFVTAVSMQAKPDDTLAVSFHPGGIGFISRQKIRLMRENGQAGQFEYAAQFIDMEKENIKLLDDYFALCKTWVM